MEPVALRDNRLRKRSPQADLAGILGVVLVRHLVEGIQQQDYAPVPQVLIQGYALFHLLVISVEPIYPRYFCWQMSHVRVLFIQTRIYP